MSIASAATARKVAPGHAAAAAAAGVVGFILGAVVGFMVCKACYVTAKDQPLAIWGQFHDAWTAITLALSLASTFVFWSPCVRRSAVGETTSPQVVPAPTPAVQSPQAVPAPTAASSIAGDTTSPQAVPAPTPLCPHDRVTSHGSNGTHIQIRCRVCGEVLFHGKK